MEPVMFVMAMLVFMGWYISHETGKRLAVVRRQRLIVEKWDPKKAGYPESGSKETSLTEKACACQHQCR
uniref:NADH dehydrogenase [ubiquinone] 1 alpha subcomplex subunit 1 n=1 Tax=Anguilla anguilla TaxID=7936 RepID=A0A0E9SE45_ANGAN